MRNGYALWESNGTPYNLITKVQLDASPLVGAPTWVPTPDGAAPDLFDGATDRGWDFPFEDLLWLNGASEYAVLIVLDNDAMSGSTWSFKFDSSASGNQFQLFANETSDFVRHRVDFAGETPTTIDDDYTPYPNSRVVVVLQYDREEVSFWRDGVKRNTVAFADKTVDLTIQSGSNSLSFGYNGESGDRSWDGRIPAFYMWGRALSDDEIRLLTEDPYGPFRPNWDYVTAAGQDVAVGQATEVEAANPITPLIDREVAVGQATEAEGANPITARISREVLIGQVVERELARPITPDVEGPILVDVGQATERELARPIVPFIEGLVIGDITCVVIQPTATCAILSPSATCEFRL